MIKYFEAAEKECSMISKLLSENVQKYAIYRKRGDIYIYINACIHIGYTCIPKKL